MATTHTVAGKAKATSKAKRKPRGDTVAKGPSKAEAARMASDGQAIATMPKKLKAAAAQFAGDVAAGKPAKAATKRLEAAVAKAPKAPRQRSGVHYEVRRLLCRDLSLASRPAEIVAAISELGHEITEQALTTVLNHWKATIAALQEAGLIHDGGEVREVRKAA